MTNNPLYVSFVWHMHQPYYKDPRTGVYRLPWVRLHGTKDYLDMLEIVRDFPAIRQNFNLVPSLLEQLNDYTENDATDSYLEATRKRASDLTPDDKIFILENFFLAHWENMIKPFSRYYELLTKRGTRFIRTDLVRTIKYFTEPDFLDLQVLFNLCWIDPSFREKDHFLKVLVEKGRNYTEEEKDILIEKQRQILKRIIPAYREMAAAGQVELSCSPFYHPITPLLCNSDISRVAMPGVTLPRNRFSHPEDAQKQIEMAIEYFEKVFDYRPSGMWPSEGSVSEQVLRMMSSSGIHWVATDEGILAHSLRKSLRDHAGNLTDPQALYRPYRFEDISIVFRDHTISDLIGFVYSQWDSKKAAEDLIGKLLYISNTMPTDRPRLVSIILDGENAWEHYKNDGRDFFQYLYEGLSREERLQTITVSEFMKAYDKGERLEYLHPGSWINSNFGIWIGHEEDNLSWDYLTNTRESLEHYQRENPDRNLEKAWKSIYIAEGSDWNWWYGDEHTTDTQEEFDELFRLNLMEVFKRMGKEIPAELFVPVLRHDRKIAPTMLIRGFIQPHIDGLVTSYYEWYQGAQVDVKKSGGSMHKSESLISSLFYGFNIDSLFLRIDPKVPFDEFEEGTEISIITTKPADIKVTVPVKRKAGSAVLFEKSGDDWIITKELTEVALLDIFEIAVPFADLKAKANEEIQLFFSIGKGAAEIERCPWRGHLSITVPTADFEALMWY
jgi:alpha-amylase/alpha-mannosidase (GH57 family)